jgi:tRNA (guanine-N(7)-)-methyltransferase subunit TRM82
VSFIPSVLVSVQIDLTSDRIPALFTFLLTPENALKHIQTLRVPGNALAVATCKSASESNVVVSVDCIHKPGSTTERRQGIEEAAEPLQLYKFQDHELVAASTFMLADGDDEYQSVRLTNLLYNLEYLRKRDGETRELE